MVTQHYRWDFIGLSSYDKPTPETSEKVVDGSTYYEADTSKLYIFYKDTWYEKTATGGGGGGGDITVVQTTGTSTTDVMSQDATTSMVYADPATLTKVQIGINAESRGNNSVVIGNSASDDSANNSVIIGNVAHCGAANQYDVIALGNLSSVESHSSISIGRSAKVGVNLQGGIALGAYSTVTRKGELNIGTSWNATGYNNTLYRIIGGVHDGQDAHDAVTVEQVNATIDAINTALNTNIPHIGA